MTKLNETEYELLGQIFALVTKLNETTRCRAESNFDDGEVIIYPGILVECNESENRFDYFVKE